MNTSLPPTTPGMRWEIYAYLMGEAPAIVARQYKKWGKLGYSTIENLYEDAALTLAGPLGAVGAFQSDVSEELLEGPAANTMLQNKLKAVLRTELERDCINYNERRHERHTEDGLDGAAAVAVGGDTPSVAKMDLDNLIERQRPGVRNLVRAKLAGFKPGEIKASMPRRQYVRDSAEADNLLRSWADDVRRGAAAFGTIIFALFRRDGGRAAETAAAAGGGGAAVAGGGAIAGKVATGCVVACLAAGGAVVAKSDNDDRHKTQANTTAKAEAKAPKSLFTPIPQAEKPKDAKAKSSSRKKSRRKASSTSSGTESSSSQTTQSATDQEFGVESGAQGTPSSSDSTSSSSSGGGSSSKPEFGVEAGP